MDQSAQTGMRSIALQPGKEPRTGGRLGRRVREVGGAIPAWELQAERKEEKRSEVSSVKRGTGFDS